MVAMMDSNRKLVSMGTHIGGFALAVTVTVLAAGTSHASDTPPALNGFERTTDKGVIVWRGRNPAQTPATANAIPPLLGERRDVVEKVVIKRIIRYRTSPPAKLRTIGFFSGKGKRIPFTKGFYSGNTRQSRQYVQGFYSGYRTKARSRFPLERPDGFRKVKR